MAEPGGPSGTDARLLVVVMGVSGTGKSTLAAQLAGRLGCTQLEGDDFHPAANVAKMSAGVPLDDSDRESWLTAIRRAVAAEPGTVVLSCSALRHAYRERLRSTVWSTLFLHLAGPRDVIARRLAARPDHFMPATLLDSQLATLEPLASDEPGIQLDITYPISTLTTLSASFIAAHRSSA